MSQLGISFFPTRTSNVHTGRDTLKVYQEKRKKTFDILPPKVRRKEKADNKLEKDRKNLFFGDRRHEPQPKKPKRL